MNMNMNMDTGTDISMNMENGLDPNVLGKRTIRILIVGPANEENYQTL